MIENHINGLMYGFLFKLVKFNILVPALSFSEVAASLVSGDGLRGGVSDTCDTFSPSSTGELDFSSYGGKW